MKTKAFTIIEILLATMLAGILVLGTAAVLDKMQTQSAGFRTRINNDMIWIETSRHLAQMVRASSYLELGKIGTIPDPNTLILYKYDKAEKGRYANDAANHRIIYTDVVTKQQFIFNNINATFAYPQEKSKKGMKGDKYIEIVIAYASPFAGTMRLRCAVDVQGTIVTGVTIIGGTIPCHARDIIQTSDGDFLIIGVYTLGPSQYGTMMVKVSSDLTTVKWYSTFPSDGGVRGFYEDYNVKEMFDNKGKSIGYIFSVDHGSLLASGYSATMVMTNTAGTITASINPSGVAATCVSPIFAGKKDKAVTGYIFVGGTWYYDSVAKVYHYPMVVAKTNTSGQIVWSKLYEFNVSGTISGAVGKYVDQLYDVSGNPAGFAITAQADTWSPKRILFLTIDNTANGNPVSAWAIATNSSHGGIHIKQVYNSNGASDGFVIGSGPAIGTPVTLGVYRLDQSGNYKWSKGFYANRPVPLPTPYRVCPTNDGYFVASAQDSLVKMNDLGVTQISASYPFYQNSIDARVHEILTLSENPTYDKDGKANGYIAAGRTTYQDAQIKANYSMYIVKTDINLACGTITSPNIVSFPAANQQSYPSNSNSWSYGTTTIKVPTTLISKNPGDP